jgi:hypothetical protein
LALRVWGKTAKKSPKTATRQYFKLLNTIPVLKFAAKIGGCAEKEGGKSKKVQNLSL